jgi:3-oxoadipate enol-lactonase
LAPPRAGRVSVNGLQLYYAEQGQGPAVVFLHGLGSASADWQLQFPVFAPHYHVIAPDLRAHGQSEAGPFFWTVATLADEIALLMEELQAGPAHVVGLSLGGCVAQALALRRPALVRSLTLVNTFARLRPAGWRGARRMVQRLWLLCFAPMTASAAFIAGGLFPKPEQADFRAAAIARLSQNSRRAYFAAIRAILTFDVCAQLPTLHCPTLIVAGDQDTTVALAAKKEQHRLIPGAQLVVVTDSGHATPYDQAEVFNQTVLEFMNQH